MDIEVRTKNKDEKIGGAQKETDSKKDGKNGSCGEQQTSAMEVDDKHEKEASASAPRSERGSPEAEGWMVVNEDTMRQGIYLHFEFLPVTSHIIRIHEICYGKTLMK